MAKRKDAGSQSRPGSTRQGTPPLRKGSGSSDPGSSPGQAEPGRSGGERIIPNKNRVRQVAPTSRKLFDDEAKAEFLEWFAATCNISLAARKAGFHYRTVLRHWREDEAFGARGEAALQMGYVRLEALALRSAEEALTRAAPPLKGDRPAPAETLAMDPSVALQLLRDHKRGPTGAGSGPGSKRGQRPRVATNAEVREALTKRLKAYRDRVRARNRAAAGATAAESASERDPD